MIYKNIEEIPKDKYVNYYIDFPWFWPNRKKGTKFGGGTPYPTMKITEIYDYCEILKPKIPDNSVCFSWINTNHNNDADLRARLKTFEVMGFRNTGIAFIWEKVTKRGTPRKLPGHYQSNSMELAFLGIKGNVRYRQTVSMWEQVYPHILLKHSEKPSIFREQIDTIFPTGDRIELFSRHIVDGWDQFGNEV